MHGKRTSQQLLRSSGDSVANFSEVAPKRVASGILQLLNIPPRAPANFSAGPAQDRPAVDTFFFETG